MNTIVVFCGAGEGYTDIYRETAYSLGALLADRQITLVYGGSKRGIMGALATGALDRKGMVYGVLPHFLQTEEVAHEGLTELILVRTMHERKMKMHELSDGIIALPGGWGTLEELFEMMTWAQLGLHQKPIGILNINGFYDPLITQFSIMLEEGFLKEIFRKIILVSEDMEELLDMMYNYVPPALPQIISKSVT